MNDPMLEVQSIPSVVSHWPITFFRGEDWIECFMVVYSQRLPQVSWAKNYFPDVECVIGCWIWVKLQQLYVIPRPIRKRNSLCMLHEIRWWWVRRIAFECWKVVEFILLTICWFNHQEQLWTIHISLI